MEDKKVVEMESLELRQIVAKLIKEGLQLSPEAIEFLARIKEPDKIINNLIAGIRVMKPRPLILTLDVILKILGEEEENEEEEIEENIDIVFDASNLIGARGRIEDFVAYFMSRFNKIRQIFMKERYDIRGTRSIIDIKKYARENEKVKLIVMIIGKKKINDGKIILEVEDPTGAIRVIVPQEKDLTDKVEKIVKDEVIYLEGKVTRDYIILSDISQPEVPRIDLNNKVYRRNGRVENDIYAVLISDLHIGSKYFMRSAFNRFVLWINGKLGRGKIRRIAKRVKYLIIAGDIVDGIGIYPNQEEELLIKDIKKQYEVAAKYLSQISVRKRIIIIPGNHDATRQALPSPAIFKEYAKPLYELPNITILGDPAYIKLHNVLFLVTHGRSLDDILSSIPGTHYDNPAEAMVELLKRRHLAPIYGGKTQIAPEPEDYLVIDKVPEVFHAGHVHTFGYLRYRGVLIVNSGTWQRQTGYMKAMGIKPNPGKAVVVSLSRRKVEMVLDFATEELVESLELGG